MCRDEWKRERAELIRVHNLQVNELYRRIDSRERECAKLDGLVDRLSTQRNGWWAMPWYKRVWSALKGRK